MWYTIKPGSWLRNQRRAHELGHHRSPPYYEGSSGCNPPLLVDDSLGFCWGTLKTCLNQKISCGYNWFVWWLVDDYMIWYDIYGVILSNMNHYELGDDHPIHFHWEIRTLKTWSRWYPPDQVAVSLIRKAQGVEHKKPAGNYQSLEIFANLIPMKLLRYPIKPPTSIKQSYHPMEIPLKSTISIISVG